MRRIGPIANGAGEIKGIQSKQLGEGLQVNPTGFAMRKDVLPDGTISKTITIGSVTNQAGIRPEPGIPALDVARTIEQAPQFIALPEPVELVRGLVCIPAADLAPEGWLGGDPANAPAPIWDNCTDGYLGSVTPPYAKVVAPSSGRGNYPPVVRGQRGPIPSLGLQYRNVSWIGETPVSGLQKDYLVLSWYSPSARYAMTPPQSIWLWFGAQVVAGIPNETGCEGFLGAAIGEWGGQKYLVAAVLFSGGGETKTDVNANNWCEVWAGSVKGGANPGCGIGTMTHCHWPIRFYRRIWLDGTPYSDDDLIGGTNPNGWQQIGQVSPFVPVSGTYTRAWTHPRVVAGVYFSPDGKKAAWSLVDEWSTGTENVSNFCGYQTVDVGDGSIAIDTQVENPYQGSKWTDEFQIYTCTNDVLDDGFDCAVPYECDDAQPSNRTQDSYYTSDIIQNGVTWRFTGDKVVAVDYDRSGNLVQLVLTIPEWKESGETTRHNFELHWTDNRMYYCDPVLNNKSELHVENGSSRFDVDRAQKFWVDFKIVGNGKEYVIPAFREEDGSYSLDYEDRVDWGLGYELIECGSLERRNTRCGGIHSAITKNGSRRVFSSVQLQYLDLRHYHVTYTRYYRNWGNWASTTEEYSKSLSGSPPNEDCNENCIGENLAGDDDEAWVDSWVIDDAPAVEVAKVVLKDENSTEPPTPYTCPGSGNQTLSQHWNCNNVPPDSSNSVEAHPVPYPLESRTGITGVFDVDASENSPGNWDFSELRKDYGAADELNVMVSGKGEVLGKDESNVWQMYTTGQINYLTGTDFETHFGIDGQAGALGIELGTI